MKWRLNSNRRALLFTAAGLLAAVFAGHAELSRWVENIEPSGKLEAVFFRLGVRRPAKETRPELSKLIAGSSSTKDLYSLRALEDEQALDFAAAEADWKQYGDPLSLADFYHRRLQPGEELAALDAAAREPAPPTERFTAPAQQRSWKLYQRIFGLIAEQGMPVATAAPQYRQWIERYPKDPAPYLQYFDFAIVNREYAVADEASALYAKQFPDDAVFPVSAKARMEQVRGSVDKAVAVYDAGFQPSWPPELVASYFELLKQTGSLRKFLERSRAGVLANPLDLAAAARIFYYYQQQGNLQAAQRALLEYRQRKESRKSVWKAEELSTLAELFEGAHDYEEAARAYYGLYSLDGASPAMQEKALNGIASILLTAPEQPIRFGSGDLSLYKDVATMDPYPGFLNGVLSLLLNSVSPDLSYSQQDQAAKAYFHRARASELLALFDTKFPSSTRRPALHALLIHAYDTYGDNEGVIRSGKKFLVDFATAAERSDVAGVMADAYARTNQVNAEFAIYDDLLKELAAKADGVPIGEVKAIPAGQTEEGTPPDPAIRKAIQVQVQKKAGPADTSGPRSPEYARILDRYIARLTALKRPKDALPLYRRELDRNGNDPGLYERLAAYLEENKLGVEAEQTYRRAIQQFPDSDWNQKLARWYLRKKQTAQYDQLTRDVVKTFSGTELEKYFAEVATRGSLNAQLYLQVNTYAHQRFPHNLTFVRNLLNAYTTKGTENPSAYEALLRSSWYYNDDLRARFFELLSRTKRLSLELASLRTANAAVGKGQWQQFADANPGGARMLAEGEAWRSHFEQSAPGMQALALNYPADPDTARRAAAMNRSLAASDETKLEVAVAIDRNLNKYQPRDHGVLTQLGELYADGERYDLSKPFWNRLAEIEPGKPEGYLEAATVFWDYYQYADALRMIGDGRKRLKNSSLYAYEAGAIYENQRDYPRAIDEYARGVANGDSGQAQARLITLAKRPALRPRVEEATLQLVAQPNPEQSSFNLRVALLQSQNRHADLEALLLSAADRSTALDLLLSVDSTGRIEGLDRVQERVRLRQIAITTDPIDRARYRLSLARFYEGEGRQADASRVYEALYKERPASLGIIRATVDYYARAKNLPKSVDVLQRAASIAQPSYRAQFTFEAARKATEAGDYNKARTLLATLRQTDPWKAEYLAAVADTFGRQGDDKGLRIYYTDTLKALKDAPLAADERTERIAAMRRGYIPVLTRLKDYSGAIDQYIEIVNRFPEDEQLAKEAANYAAGHQSQARLTDYYTKTMTQSPKDFRWPLVLARIETEFEQFPSAIAAYTTATAVRPDRADLFIARAKLEEKMLRFDEASKTYAKIYELTYRNSQWMERVAEMEARQGHAPEAVGALTKALIDGRPDRPENYFSVAARLEQWNFLAQSRDFAEKGIAKAKPNVTSDPAYFSGVDTYMRVMTKLRQHGAAYTMLSGMVAKTAQPAEAQTLRACLRTMATTVGTHFSPEEKAAFAIYIKPLRGMAADVATLAALHDVAAALTYQRTLKDPASGYADIEAMQQRRMRFSELGQQLEAIAKVTAAESRDAVYSRAAEAYRSAGDTSSELRVLPSHNDRYFELLLKARQQAFASQGDAAANYSLQNGTAAITAQTINALAAKRPIVWQRAYASLVGLYYGNATPVVRTAFLEALGDVTIGERIGKPADRSKQLTGDQWFYYGARFGEYLSATKQPNAADYLPASLEATPGRSSAYFQLAEYYRDSGDKTAALTDYRYALELNPKRGDAHDRIADILWDQGDKTGAIAEWKRAIEAFTATQDQRRVPPDFWVDVEATLTDIGTHKALPGVRDDADKLLKTYIRRNGNYQVEGLLRGAVAAAGDPVSGTQWIVELSRSAADPVEFLGAIARSEWMPDAQRDQLYDRTLALAREKSSLSVGEAGERAKTVKRQWERESLDRFLERKMPERVQALLTSLSVEDREQLGADLTTVEIRLAAQTRSLPALLDRYKRDLEKPPAIDSMRRAAELLKDAGDDASARRALEFVYTHELDAHSVEASNFLGLAEIRLDENDVPAALALLRRMNRVAGDGFEEYVPAADLLTSKGRVTEAAEFLAARVKAEPWDAAAKRKLGEAQRNIPLLAELAASNELPYPIRAEAALAIRKDKGDVLHTAGTELNLLSSQGAIAVTAAEQPYYYYARVTAADDSADPIVRIRLLLGAIAINPGPSEPRSKLFRAALDAKRYQLALSAMEPIANTVFNGEESGQYAASQFLFQSGFDQAQRASAARGMADAYRQLGRLPEAAGAYKAALVIEPVQAIKAGDGKALATLKAALALRAANDARRPIVSESLDQDRVVKQRLIR